VNFLNKIHFFFLRQHGFFFPQKGQIDSDAAGVMKLPHPRIFSDKLRIFRLRYITLTDQNFISSSASVVGVASFFFFFSSSSAFVAASSGWMSAEAGVSSLVLFKFGAGKRKKKSLIS
jgi:hypothetical protein